MRPPDGPQCESLLVEPDSIHHLSAWAARRNQPVTVFDVEATTFTPAVKSFGITEVALLHIYPDGTAWTRSALVNPERNIPKAVRELTGITNEAVRGQRTWEAWTSCMHDVAAGHLTVGYHSMGFDCPGVVRQNARYGHEGTEFVTHLDVASLPGVSGKLIDAAAERGSGAARLTGG